MAIDEPNQGLSSDDKQIYSDLGLTDTPFENVRYYYPYSKSDVAKVQSYAAPSDIEQQRGIRKLLHISSHSPITKTNSIYCLLMKKTPQTLWKHVPTLL